MPIGKTTSDQLKYSATVEQQTAAHGESLANKVTKLVWGAETPPVSLALVVRALLVLLQVASRALRTADARHMDELADDDPARAERDAAAKALRSRIFDIESSIVGTFGEAYAGRVGLAGRLETREDMLARRARRIVHQLRTVAAPAPRLEGVTMDLALIAARLEEATGRLDAAISAVGTEESQADATLVARNQAGEHWERVIRLVANFMVGLAEVAGELGIASRIRPTSRRLRGELDGDDLDTEVLVDPGEDGGDEPALDDPLVGPTEPES